MIRRQRIRESRALADGTSTSLGGPSGALAGIERLTIALTAAIAATETEFRNGELDMAEYAQVSHRLKLIVDDFFSAYP